MAINVNPGNFQGLAAVAGRNTGGLGLHVPGSGLLGYKQLDQQRQNQQMGMLSNLGKSLMGKSQDDQQMAMQQEKLGMAQQGQQHDMAMDERKMAMAEQAQGQQRALEEHRTKILELAKQDEGKINEMGSFAASARLSMEQVDSEPAAQELQSEIIKESYTNGYINEDEAQKLVGLSPERFKSALDMKILQLGKVNEYQKMRPNKKEGAQGSSAKVTLPDGTVIESQAATAPTKSQMQKDIITANDNINELSSMYKNVPDNFFGSQALGQWKTIGQEWVSGVPGMEGMAPSPQDKEKLASYSAFKGQSEMNAMSTIKQLSGVQYSDKQLEFLKEILPSIGPTTTKSQFKGRADNLLRFFNDVKESRQKLLREGVDVSSPGYQDKMLQEIQSKSADVSQENTMKATREYYKGQGWTDKQIDDAIKSRGAQ